MGGEYEPGTTELAMPGLSKWQNQFLHGLYQQTRDWMNQDRATYGAITPETQERIDALKRIIDAEQKGGIPVSITGRGKKILFHPSEVYKAAHDTRYATTLYQEATGHERVLPQDVAEFQQRLAMQYPEVTSVGKPQGVAPSVMPSIREEEPDDAWASASQPARRRGSVMSEASRLVRQAPSRDQSRRPSLVPSEAPSVVSAAPSVRMSPLGQQMKLNKLRAKQGKPFSLIPGATPEVQQQMAHLNRYNALRAKKGMPAVTSFPGWKATRPIVPMEDMEGQAAEGTATSEAPSILSASSVIKQRQQQQLAALKAKRRLGSQLTGGMPDIDLDEPPKLTGGMDDTDLDVPSVPPPFSVVKQRQQQQLAALAAKRKLGTQGLGNAEERVRKQRELQDIHKGLGRLAPLSEEHEQAQRMFERGIGKHDETFDTAHRELEAVKHHSPSRAIEPFIDAGDEEAPAYIDRYIDRYRKNVIGALRDERKQSFLEEVLPNINMSYAQHGSFHGGVRNIAIRKAAEAQEKSLQREIARLMSQAEHQGMEQYNKHRAHRLGAGELARGAAEADQRAGLQTATALPHLAAQRTALDTAQQEQLKGFGAARQRQDQALRDTHYAEFRESEQDKAARLAQGSNIARGHQTAPMVMTSTSGGPPVAPQEANMVMGLLGQALGQRGPAPQGGFYSKGGHVKKRFADGGHVQHYHELGKHVQPLQHEGDMQQIAGEFRSHQEPDTWMDRVSQQALMNVRGSPLANIGRGAYVAHADRDNARVRMMQAKEKAANLYEAINNTRMKQHEILAAYENKRMEMGEAGRHNQAMEGYRGSEVAAKWAKVNGSGQPTLPKLDKANARVLEQANQSLLSAPTLIEDLDRLEDLSNKIATGTATTKMGITNDPYTQAKLGQGTQEDLDEFDKVANDLVVKATSAFGQRGGARIAALIEKSKPHRGMSRKGIQKVIKNMKGTLHEEMERAQHISESYESGVLPTLALGQYSRGKAKGGHKKQEEHAPESHPESHDVSSLSTEELLRIANS